MTKKAIEKKKAGRPKAPYKIINVSFRTPEPLADELREYVAPWLKKKREKLTKKLNPKKQLRQKPKP